MSLTISVHLLAAEATPRNNGVAGRRTSVGSSQIRSDQVGSRRAGSDQVGSGRARSDKVGSDRVVPGRAGPGRVGSGRVGPGRDGLESLRVVICGLQGASPSSAALSDTVVLLSPHRPRASGERSSWQTRNRSDRSPRGTPRPDR